MRPPREISHLTSSRNLLRIVSVLVPLVLVATSVSASACRRDDRAASQTRASQALAVPTLKVTNEVTGLAHPWDVKQLPAGPLLITERNTRRILVRDASGLHALSFPNGNIWVSGETGLMSLAIDPDFGDNRRFYTCHGRNTGGGGHEIAVVAWRLGPERKVASFVRTVLSGIQIVMDWGRRLQC